MGGGRLGGVCSHDSFINQVIESGIPPYDKIPLVNARDIFNYSSGFLGLGTTRINITISCDTVYQSYALDYKGNIPGEIDIDEPPPPPADRDYEGQGTGTPPPPPPPPGDETPPENCGGAGQIACL